MCAKKTSSIKVVGSLIKTGLLQAERSPSSVPLSTFCIACWIPIVVSHFGSSIFQESLIYGTCDNSIGLYTYLLRYLGIQVRVVDSNIVLIISQVSRCNFLTIGPFFTFCVFHECPLLWNQSKLRSGWSNAGAPCQVSRHGRVVYFSVFDSQMPIRPLPRPVRRCLRRLWSFSIDLESCP